MTPEQEGSIDVIKGVIYSPMMPLFKSWLDLPRTNYMTEKFQKALDDKAVKVGIAANWAEHIKRQAQAAAAKDDEPEAAPQGASVKREAPEPEKPKPAKVAAVTPPPAKIKPIVAAKDDDGKGDNKLPVARTKSVMLASAASGPPRPTETPPVQPTIAAAEATPAPVPAMPTLLQAPSSLLPAAVTQAEPQITSSSAPVPVTQAEPQAVPAVTSANPTVPKLTVPPAVFVESAPAAPVPPRAAQGVVAPDALVPAANAQGEPPKAVTTKVALPPESYGPSLEPIQQELTAINKLIKAHRDGAGAEKAEIFLYGKVENGHLSSKELVELANKMQNATTDPKMRETVTQLGKDLGQLTTQSAKGSARDVQGKAPKDAAVIQRS
ncbi:MAG: hypothetical protein K2X09_03650 [Rickettsiales bacterium]|nr:hypothetical protein [Rickettsiales bacterium]